MDYDVLKVCNCSDCKLLDKSKLLEKLICKIEIYTKVHNYCKDSHFLLLELALEVNCVPSHVVNHGIIGWSVVDYMPRYRTYDFQEIPEHLFRHVLIEVLLLLCKEHNRIDRLSIT